jgi:hypothetical protein
MLTLSSVHALIHFAKTRGIRRKTHTASKMRGLALYRGKHESIPVFQWTISLLCANKQIYAEALPYFRRAPLVVSQDMIDVFTGYGVSIAHYIPFRSLKNVHHIHFDDLATLAAAVDRFIWTGEYLAREIINTFRPAIPLFQAF